MNNNEIKEVKMPNGETILEGMVYDQWGIPVTAILCEDNYLLELPF